MRPYQIDGPRYRVPVERGARICGTRNQAGMQFTAMRSNHGSRRPMHAIPSPGYLLICIGGTYDELRHGTAGGFYPKAKRHPCPCCGAKSGGKFYITDKGRQRLARLKLSRENRNA